MADGPGASELLFEIMTPLGFQVRVTRAYWTLITTIKHPVMVGREEDVKETLRNPRAIRQSQSDKAVYLSYQPEHTGRWICAVAKRLNGDGFLITAYPTDGVKEGEVVWPR